jgi:hypothetical protein
MDDQYRKMLAQQLQHMNGDFDAPVKDGERLQSYVRSVGAGVVDPFGATSWAAGKLGYPNAAAHLQEARGENPNLANAASGFTSAFVPVGAAAIPGHIAAFGARQGMNIWAKQLGGLALPSAMAGSSAVQVDPRTNMRLPARAQSRHDKAGF